MNIEAFEALIESSLNSGCGGLYICASEARDLIALVRTAEQDRDKYKFWYENETMKFVSAADEITIFRCELESLRAKIKEAQEPVAYCFVDVNGKPSEFCSSPETQDFEDKRIIKALFSQPVILD